MASVIRIGRSPMSLTKPLLKRFKQQKLCSTRYSAPCYCLACFSAAIEPTVSFHSSDAASTNKFHPVTVAFAAGPPPGRLRWSRRRRPRPRKVRVRSLWVRRPPPTATLPAHTASPRSTLRVHTASSHSTMPATSHCQPRGLVSQTLSLHPAAPSPFLQQCSTRRHRTDRWSSCC